VSRPIGAGAARRVLAIPFVSIFYVLVHDIFERRRVSTAAATVVTSEATSTG
jgi:hypothetical protein